MLVCYKWFEKGAHQGEKRHANETISINIVLGHIFPYLQWNKCITKITSFFYLRIEKCVEISAKFEENTSFGVLK